jgi:hypothetical protein
MDFNPFNSGRATQQTVQENKFLIPEEIPAQERTAFHGAAAAAHKAGKSHFSFAGKKHPVTMKKDTADAIADDVKEGMYKDMEIKRQDKEMDAKPVPAKKKKDAKGGGKEGDVEMNPKMDSEKKMPEQKESKIRSALKSVLERKENHSPNQDKAEKIGDNLKGQGAKDMMAAADDAVSKGPQAHLNEPEIDKKNFQNMTKNVPSKKMRGNDNPKGDTKIVPGGTQFKDPAAMKPEESVTKGDDNQSGGFVKKESVSFAQSITNMGNAYASMYATEETELEEDLSHMHKHADSLADDHSAAAKAHDSIGNSDAAKHHRKAAAALTAGDYKGASDHGSKAVNHARVDKYADGKLVRTPKQTAAMKKSNAVYSKHVNAHYKQGN